MPARYTMEMAARRVAPSQEASSLSTLRPVHHLSIAALLVSHCLAVHAGAPAPSAPALPALQAACSADARPDAALPNVQVRAMPAAADDLPYIEAQSRATNARVRIYHDPDLADAAASKAACFMGMLDLLPPLVPEARAQRTWSPMVITRRANYIPPKRDGELRWVNEFDAGGWSPRAIDFLVSVMPHEETHLVQGDRRRDLPRWFEEGHADWVGLQVSAMVSPGSARSKREQRARDFRSLAIAHLGAWGGLQVKPEAVERQLSPEDRARRAQDPSYNPPGPFRFTREDLVEDNGNEAGRYGAALALFEGLEARHGRPAVQAWASAVLASTGESDIPALALQVLGEDIAPLLR